MHWANSPELAQPSGDPTVRVSDLALDLPRLLELHASQQAVLLAEGAQKLLQLVAMPTNS